ncbi:MAG: ABC transporter substrate-binding protein [Dissulfurispiraceae bacterium]
MQDTAGVRIGHLSTFYHTAMLLMAEGVLEKKMKTHIEWKLLGTGPAIVNAFEKGELDLAYVGLPPAIIGIARGVSIKCIAGGHIEGTVMCGRNSDRGFPEIDDPGAVLRQFAGLKIGVPGNGSIHDVILTDCLDRSNLNNAIEVIHFPWADMIIEAMVKGEVSAAVGTPALAVALERYARGRILYPPAKLWPYNPSYGIISHNGFLALQRELVEAFLVAHEEASCFLRRSPEEAASIISGYLGFIDKAFVLDTLKVSPKYCAQLTDEYVGSTMDFAAALRKLGYINRDVSREEIFDSSLIRKIHPPGDHY